MGEIHPMRREPTQAERGAHVAALLVARSQILESPVDLGKNVAQDGLESGRALVGCAFKKRRQEFGNFFHRDLARELTGHRAAHPRNELLGDPEAEARAVRAVGEAAQRRLDDYVVRAPSAGVVLRRDAEVGEVVDTPAALFWIGEPKPLRITAEVDEEDIAQIREGQRALLRADAFAGQVLNATVAQITPKGDATRKAYRVRLALPEDTPLMIGMTVEANIVLRESADAVLIPPAALRGDHVFVAQGEVARRRQVTVGVQGPRAVEIRQGIAAGDVVVLDPPQGLRDGQALRLKP